MKAIVSVFILSLSFCISILAQPGSLDNGFGTNGIIRSEFGNNFHKNHKGFVVKVQPDEKILTAGSSADKAVLARFNPDGSVDSLHGTGGFFVKEGATIFNGAYVEKSSIHDFVFQPDGKIVAIGTADIAPPPNFMLVQTMILFRFNPDGSHDSSFGVAGYGYTWLGMNSSGSTVALQPDGKILIAGGGPGTGGILARYLANGIRDSTFAVNGILNILSFVATSVLVQPDGKIVVGGFDSPASSDQSDFVLIRYHADGSLDTGFGFGGISVVNITSQADVLYAMKLLPDGKIIAAGKAGDDLAVARFSNGVLDQGYGQNGLALIHLAGKNLVANAFVIQPDGKLLAAGCAGPQNSEDTDFLLTRLTPGGYLDDSFGNGGFVFTHISPKDDQLSGISLQPDGKIVVTGYASKEYTTAIWPNEFVVARYFSGLEVDAPEVPASGNELRIIPNPVSDFLNFQLSSAQLPEDAIFRIVNVAGQVVEEVKAGYAQTNFVISTGDWVPGVYFLQYLEAGQVRASEQFIKQ